MFHIVLYRPQIPQNTGNIARTCAATGCALHLVRPLAFSIDDKHVRRAGLDYWDKVSVFVYDDFQTLLQRHRDKTFFFVETSGGRRYDEVCYPAGSFFVFGRETTGLPKTLLAQHASRIVRLPMLPSLRSLNLSNAAAVMVYEALRQHGFSGLVLNRRTPDAAVNSIYQKHTKTPSMTLHKLYKVLTIARLYKAGVSRTILICKPRI